MPTSVPSSRISDRQDSHSYRRRAFGKLLDVARDRIDLLWSQTDIRCHSIAEKLGKCCRDPQIISMNDGERYYLTESRCRSRLCPRCSKIRASLLAQRIAKLLCYMDCPRFLTLTVRSNDQSLRCQLKHLRKKFACLRKSPAWRHYVAGGIYTIEITWNQSTQQWHPHIHAIIDGKYWPHHDLLEKWSQILHYDGGVDIRLVHGNRKIANYLACYVAKSCDLSQLPPDQLAEWAVETHALRLAQTFGFLHGTHPAQDRVSASTYRILPVNVNTIAKRAELGDKRCEEVLSALTGSHPCDRPDFLRLVAIAIPPPEHIPRIIETRPKKDQNCFKFRN